MVRNTAATPGEKKDAEPAPAGGGDSKPDPDKKPATETKPKK